MKSCLLNEAFLTKRRHQRQTSNAIYDIGAKLRLAFAKPNTNISLDGRLLIRLSTSYPSAFGTTNLHPTTKWCAEMLEKYLVGSKILDVGTGAGILTLCALRLIMSKENGYLDNFQIDAFDIYQDAIKQAKINLRLNGLERYVNLRQGVLTDYPENFYSTLIANLPPIAISELWLKLIEKIADNGRLILSGILKHNFSTIVEKLTRAGFKLIDQVTTDLWCLIVLEKHS